jgi:hypothetical protein
MAFIRLLLLASFVSCLAFAAPVSSCAANPPSLGGFTCNVYPSLADGTPSELSDIFNLFDTVTAGFIVLLDSPTADPQDVSQWSDVLELIDNGEGNAATARLMSNGCNCFPTFDTVSNYPSGFLVENQSGSGDDFVDFTAFTGGLNTFNIYSASRAVESGDVPEPATLALMGGGLSFLAYFKISRKALARWLSAPRSR